MTTCTVPPHNNATSADNLYGPRACWQAFIDWVWNTHDFDFDSWHHGFGYEDPCNIDLPMSRTFAAFWLLNYSAEDYNNDQYSNNMLHWGRRYVRDQFHDVRARCGDGTANATTFSYWIFGSHVELYLPFFYSLDAAGRAGTLVHESRHFGGKGHDANFPSWSAFGSGRSGADSSWGYQGAWMYDALYLWWFYAAGSRTTPALRQAAKQRAQFIIDNAFATHPGIVIS
jgi:hypothetical protein